MSNSATIAFDYYGCDTVEMGQRGGVVTCENCVIIAAYPVDDMMFISDGEYLWCIEQLEYFSQMNRFLSA